MDDDHYDLMGDAAQEAADDFERRRTEEEHGDAIRDSVDRRELLALMSRRHSAEWPNVARELAKAEKRLKEREYEEAVFHAGRAFDGYIGAVCVDPIREQVVAKFERLLPEVSEDDLLKQVSGLVGGAAFTFYAISSAIEDHDLAKTLLGTFRDFIGTREKSGAWKLRNPMFHTTATTNAGQAKPFVDGVTKLLAAISAPLREIVEVREKQRQEEYRSASHIFVSRALAAVFERDKAASLGAFDWQAPSECNMGEIQTTLYDMLGDGFVARSSGGIDEHWKLTPRGYAHWKRDIQPHIADQAS